MTISKTTCSKPKPTKAMKRETKNPRRMQFKNNRIVKKYLEAKQLREQRLWKMVGNTFVTFLNGEWLSMAEFDERYPILKQTSLLINFDNPNKSRNFSL